MTQLKLLVLAALALTLSAGCESDPAYSDPTPAYVSPNGKADTSAYPIGTYRPENTATPGEFISLSMKTDGTFHWERFVECQGSSCNPVDDQSGLWKYLIKDQEYHLMFWGQSGQTLGRYAYQIHGDSLSLGLEDGAGNWLYLQRSAMSWCATSTDCDRQNLGVPESCIDGSWVCNANDASDNHVCVHHCDDPEPADACTVAGGICVTAEFCADAKGQIDQSFACPDTGSYAYVCCRNAQ